MSAKTTIEVDLENEGNEITINMAGTLKEFYASLYSFQDEVTKVATVADGTPEQEVAKLKVFVAFCSMQMQYYADESSKAQIRLREIVPEETAKKEVSDLIDKIKKPKENNDGSGNVPIDIPPVDGSGGNSPIGSDPSDGEGKTKP